MSQSDAYAGWVCDGCGKHVTGSMPVDQCSDCGGRWFEATPDRLACDRCGHEDASRVFNSEHNRLCEDCIQQENREKGEEGLYCKYEVRKDGEPVSECFVLEPANDPAAREALRTYAEETDDDSLAMDLGNWIQSIEGSK